MAEKVRRSWLACRVAEEARSANSSNCSPMRFSALILSLPKDAASAIEILIERARIIGGAGALERGDHEAGIGAFQRVLGLADDTALTAPAVERPVPEVVEDARRLARGKAEPLGFGERLDEHGLQARVA